ncbi:hypothetical protein glysoja_007051 [Glycine soja]|nr:hypothetical protein JHK87_021953 [Glycine soja]KHN38009.1 hypothetical protein glysoja_007051 [Glycine soja]
METKFQHLKTSQQTTQNTTQQHHHHYFLFHNPPPNLSATGATIDKDPDVRVATPSHCHSRPRDVSGTDSQRLRHHNNVIEGNHRNVPGTPPLTNTANHCKPLAAVTTTTTTSLAVSQTTTTTCLLLNFLTI